ncbi:MAG TPA: hypothetical protein VFB73_06900 [Chloroflexota bacterium]|nr:hypothetical protein [Chloroflexota bacterium]
MSVRALPSLRGLVRRPLATAAAVAARPAAADWAVMDAEAYHNQLVPWLGRGHARWLATHTRPGPAPGFVLVPRALYEAFLHRRSYRGITPEEEARLGLPHRSPPPYARDVWGR